MKKGLLTIIAAMLTGAVCADLTGYEKTISSPADGGAGPALWYKSGAQRSANDLHILNSGSAGASYTAHHLAAALSADLWGNANMAFLGDPYVPGVSGSSGLFTTGEKGTVSFLFKTPATIPDTRPLLFSQGATFKVLLNINGKIRIDHVNGGTKYIDVVSVKTDTWYYFAMKWDTSRRRGGLRWYLGEADGRLRTGTLAIDRAGDPYAPIQFNQAMVPMQQIAIWDRELSKESIEAQFAAIP